MNTSSPKSLRICSVASFATSTKYKTPRHQSKIDIAKDAIHDVVEELEARAT
jgi:hypothetical protein